MYVFLCLFTYLPNVLVLLQLIFLSRYGTSQILSQICICILFMFYLCRVVYFLEVFSHPDHIAIHAYLVYYSNIQHLPSHSAYKYPNYYIFIFLCLSPVRTPDLCINMYTSSLIFFSFLTHHAIIKTGGSIYALYLVLVLSQNFSHPNLTNFLYIFILLCVYLCLIFGPISLCSAWMHVQNVFLLFC